MLLEKHHEKYNEEAQARKQHEFKLVEVKTLYKQFLNDLSVQRKKSKYI